MKLEANDIRLSATDLANHLACRHLTVLDRLAAEGRLKPPLFQLADADILRERGLEHERAYLEHLAGEGRVITRLEPDASARRGLEQTLAAMRAGADVIVQATLSAGRWLGRADVLMRVPRPSDLGDWSYEALDTKLARETKAGAILQLCLYSELLGGLQGRMPEWMHVVPPRPGFPRESYRVAQHLAYHRFVQRRLAQAVDGDRDGTYPEPVPHCEICRWWSRCDRRRRADDSLSLVAGISRAQTRELQSRGIATLARLAIEPLPLGWKPDRGSRDGYARVREQARIQLEGREQGRFLHELLRPIEPGNGLAALPAPSPGDVFLDLEADPYVDEGGLEYLFGWVAAELPPPGMLPLPAGAPAYTHAWALDRGAEQRAFEAVMDTILARWSADPDMHVYHYGAYEPGALKRLMGRHATREAEMDRLLRAGRFVNLHAVVKQSLRASVEGYSIKQLEPLYAFARAQDLAAAGAALRVIARSLELGGEVPTTDANAAAVVAYNRDDCVSALALRDWLERLRGEVEAGGESVPRPAWEAGDPTEQIGEREARARALAARLLAGVPDAPPDRTRAQHARWLLAHMLDWHRREEKAPWWEYYRLRELPDDELQDEVAALSGLEFVAAVPGPGRTPVHRYAFPAQETRIRAGDKLHVPGPDGREFGDVLAIDLAQRIVDVKKRGACAELHPASLFAHDSVGAKELAESLMRFGAWVAEHGVEGDGPHRAARDLLLGLGPRVAGHAGGDLRRAGESGIDAARRLALALDRGTLAIQGPPGSGKTYTGARMILDLVAAGKRVGVCAVSHKVVRNLLDAVVRAAGQEGRGVACVQKVREKSEEPTIPESTENAEVREALRDGTAHVAGGTGWMWSREEFADAVDVLFVDEAGQMSLANVLAIGPAAGSIVLLGDPQQLEQPIQGAHPEGTAVSALEHVLAGHATIPPERGLFLEQTWRLPPAICEFTSELFYEGRLGARAELAAQALLGDTPFAGAGLWFVPVAHDANQSASREEVQVVAALVESLTRSGVRWRDIEGRDHPLALDDVLVIAPYNAQCADLTARLPRGARVGTVDRFQGQEAPVVIYSMTSSAPEDAPRGMEFLYSPNRFNVATSRARCACILVGSPRLFEPDCHTPQQIRLANAFCRYLELARQVDVEVVAPAAATADPA